MKAYKATKFGNLKIKVLLASFKSWGKEQKCQNITLNSIVCPNTLECFKICFQSQTVKKLINLGVLCFRTG